MYKTYSIRSFILAIVVNALFLVAVAHSLQPIRAQCTTDTECAMECDGGPAGT